MGIKPIVVLLIGLVLASLDLAQAQQPTKIPRIGFDFVSYIPMFANIADVEDAFSVNSFSDLMGNLFAG